MSHHICSPYIYIYIHRRWPSSLPGVSKPQGPPLPLLTRSLGTAAARAPSRQMQWGFCQDNRPELRVPPRRVIFVGIQKFVYFFHVLVTLSEMFRNTLNLGRFSRLSKILIGFRIKNQRCILDNLENKINSRQNHY